MAEPQRKSTSTTKSGSTSTSTSKPKELTNAEMAALSKSLARLEEMLINSLKITTETGGGAAGGSGGASSSSAPTVTPAKVKSNAKAEAKAEVEVKVDVGRTRKPERRVEVVSPKTPKTVTPARKVIVSPLSASGSRRVSTTTNPTSPTRTPSNSNSNGYPSPRSPRTLTDPGNAIERGTIYLFYRPKVQQPTAHSLSEAKSIRLLLLPDLPSYPSYTANTLARKWRLITIGKKRLPVPKSVEGYPHDQSRYRQSESEEVFWANVDAVGSDLDEVKVWLDEERYEVASGPRTNAPARLSARGVYTMVNYPRFPLSKATHLGIHLSHPRPRPRPNPTSRNVRFTNSNNSTTNNDDSNFPVNSHQYDLGIVNTSLSFEIRIKNPFAPITASHQIPPVPISYPPHFFKVFNHSASFIRSLEAHRAIGKRDDQHEAWGGGGGQGEEGGGGGAWRFGRCEWSEMLDYEDVQLIFIASSRGVGMQALEDSVGKTRARALKREAESDSERLDAEDVLTELGLDADEFRVRPLKGEWA